MPAILPGVLNESFPEEIRDRIAQILLLEVPSQGVLLSDPLISGIDKIYVERSIPFSSENLPAINVLFEKIEFGDETTIGKQFTADFGIYVYGMGSATLTNRADETSNKFVQKLSLIVERILSYGGYGTLGFPRPNTATPKGVSHRKVYDVQFFNPESQANAESIVRSLVRIRVEGNQPKLVVTGVPLVGSDTEVVLWNSVQGYFYTNQP